MEDSTSIKYLSKIQVEGYKVLENTNTHFSPGLNILIGKNGSGKSTFLEFIHYILVNRHNGKRVSSFKVEADFIASNGDSYQFVIDNYKVESSQSMELWLETGKIETIPEFTLKKNELEVNIGKLISNTISQNAVINISSIFRRLNVTRYHPTYIKFDLPTELAYLSIPGTISYNDLDKLREDDEPFPDYSSSFIEIVIFLAPIKKKDLINISNINKLIPFDPLLKNKLSVNSPIQDIRFNSQFIKGDNNHTITLSFVVMEFFVNDRWIVWDQLSDGTKRLFYIIFSFHYAHGLVLLEEPELGVHPHQLHQLMNFIKEESADKQVIISTHSPYVLDVLEAEELDRIIIAKYEKGKGTQLYHLTEAQKEVAQNYIQEFGTISDYWLHSDLESEDQ